MEQEYNKDIKLDTGKSRYTSIEHRSAETIRIDHPTSSYGIFCFNSDGDLFLNSDWGFYGYAWRSYDGTFKEFLAQCNTQYIVGKFCITYIEVTGKKLNQTRKGNLEILVREFIEYLKKNLSGKSD